MGSSEDFLLKWNDHHSLFFAGAEELCASEEYTDVTLAAGQKFFSAHRLVLSICSPFFRSLFKRLGPAKTVIFLKDVDPKHLELLLEYMYKGEIKVQEHELVNVLNAAQSLEIKGLTDNGQTSESNKAKADKPSNKRPSPAPISEPILAPPVRKRPKPALVVDPSPSVITPVAPRPAVVNVKEEQEVIPVPDEPEEGPWNEEVGGGAVADYSEETGGYSNTVATGYEEMGYEGEEYYGEDGMVNMDGEGDDRGWKRYTCEVCNQACNTPSKLHQHMVVHTGEKKFKCDLCDRRFTQSGALNRHKNTVHALQTKYY